MFRDKRDLTCSIEISHDKAQSIIDEITRAYDVAEAGKQKSLRKKEKYSPY